jgi:leucine dehydrogenase
MFSHPEFDGHERAVYVNDAAAGLRAIVAIHSTALGPAFGGCRMWPYAGDEAALADALRLSRGMTYKAAICGLPYGGGKSVILGDPRREKTPALLRAMGRAVESLGGRYIIADDVGTSLDDLAVMRLETRHTAAATQQAKAPLPVTATGVFGALMAAARYAFGASDLKGLTVAVQGLGHVGYPLACMAHGKGARLIVSDLDPKRADEARREFGAAVVTPESIYGADADIFSPCALGGVLDDRTIPQLKVRLVCGGANNQLAHQRHDAALAARGICYVPDYLANAGGVIDFHQESVDDSPQAVLRAVGRIGAIAEDVLAEAKRSGRTPLQVADAMVEGRLAAAGRERKAVSRKPKPKP